MVSPSIGITFNLVYHSQFYAYSPETVAGTDIGINTETDTDTEMLSTSSTMDMVTRMVLTLQSLYSLTTANAFQ